MTDFTTPLPSGMRVREIETETTIVDGVSVVVPKLDANGNDIEKYSVAIPQQLEAADGSLAVRAALINAFVADIQSKGADVALVRADAAIAGQDPAAAEVAFTAAQAAAVTPAVTTAK